jgi:hypothetical protein
MSNIIRVKVDVTKIDKDRLFIGKKGTYLDLVLLPVRESKFGESHLVKQDVSKEDREAGVEMPILGNATEIVSQPQQRQQAPAQATKQADAFDFAGNDDLPF